MNKPLLLIEDSPSLQLTYEAALNKAGYHVQSCGAGTEGLAKFDELRPQIVLLDLMSPDRRGIEFMREILAIEPDTRVIVITANGSINLAVEAMRAGAHEFLLKPFNEQHFISAIRNAEPKMTPTRKQPKITAPPSQTMGFIGSSGVMQNIYKSIGTVAASQASVLSPAKAGPVRKFALKPFMIFLIVQKARLFRSTAEPSRQICLKAKYLATCVGRSLGRFQISLAQRQSQPVAPCSSMKSARWTSHFKPSFFGFCKPHLFSLLAR